MDQVTPGIKITFDPPPPKPQPFELYLDIVYYGCLCFHLKGGDLSMTILASYLEDTPYDLLKWMVEEDLYLLGNPLDIVPYYTNPEGTITFADEPGEWKLLISYDEGSVYEIDASHRREGEYKSLGRCRVSRYAFLKAIYDEMKGLLARYGFRNYFHTWGCPFPIEYFSPLIEVFDLKGNNYKHSLKDEIAWLEELHHWNEGQVERNARREEVFKKWKKK